ncbi:MAG: ABC transporter permease [Thermoplasmata archaeon]
MSASPDVATALPRADGALGTVPGTLRQAVILSRYQLRDYLRSRRFILMMAIVLAAGAILTTVVAYFRPQSILDNANDFYGTLGGGLVFVILFSGIIFGGDAIAGEFQNKTGYFLMGLPIKRGSVYVGKYLAALAASIVAVVVFVLILMGNAIYYLGTGAFSDPVPLVEALALSLLYLLALLGFVFLFSSLFKTSLYAVLVVAVMFLFGFTIIQGVVTALAHTEPWFLLSYANTVIGYPLTGVPAHIIITHNPVTGAEETMYNPTYVEGIVVMLGYFILTSVGGWFLFGREEFT